MTLFEWELMQTGAERDLVGTYRAEKVVNKSNFRFYFEFIQGQIFCQLWLDENRGLRLLFNYSFVAKRHVWVHKDMASIEVDHPHEYLLTLLKSKPGDDEYQLLLKVGTRRKS